MKRRRRISRPPDELAPNPFQLTDDEYHERIRDTKLTAQDKMRFFDNQPRQVRQIEHAVGNTGIARSLAQSGIRTAEEAEPVVRQMLEARAKNV